MAEGLLNSFYAIKYKAFCAGVKPTNINPYAIKVMKEINIEISNQRSKSIEIYRNQLFDYVVTVCDNANEICPFFPGKKIIHKSFKNPGNVTGDIDGILKVFRNVRDENKKLD